MQTVSHRHPTKVRIPVRLCGLVPLPVRLSPGGLWDSQNAETRANVHWPWNMIAIYCALLLTHKDSNLGDQIQNLTSYR